MRLLRPFLVHCHALVLSGLLGLLSPGIGHAGVLAVPDTPAARAIDLAPYWSVLHAPASASELDIAAVSNPALASAFQRADIRHDALSLGRHEKPVWLKLQLRNDSVNDLERYLEIGFPHIDALELYEPQDGSFQKIASGREGHFADRPFNHRHFVFPLVLSAGTQTTYYLRIHSADPLYLPARLWEPDHFFQHSQAEYMAHALYFGILLALGLYKLLLYFSLRDKVYRDYVLVAATVALALLAYSGIGHQFLWPSAEKWTRIAPMASFALACMALLSFTRHFFNTQDTLPRLDKAAQALIVLNALQVLGLAWSYPRFFLPGIVMDLMSLGLALAVAVAGGFRRVPSAGHLTAALGFLLTTAALTAAGLLGADLPSLVTLHGLQAGSAFLLLLLSMALAARFQQERRAQEAAQQELVAGLQRSEQLLEQHVAQRTAELVRSNQSLQEHQQALAVAKQVAEEALHMKSQFLANVSHEIRTPMNAVIGMAHLALRTELTAQQRDYIDKIHRSAVALLGIMNDILDFSKIEAGKMVIEHTLFSLPDVIHHVRDVTVPMTHDKEIEYLIDIAPDVPRRLIGDPLRLGQVLINLASNAIKFTQHGEVHLSCRIASSEAGCLILQFDVRDTGIGMSVAQQKRLFQSFTQADSSTSRKYGGTGLGLSISKRLVEMMGGSITVSSAPQAGSCFSVTLPCGAVHERDTTTVAVPAELRTQRMLVVDDHPIALRILTGMLNHFQLTPDTAASGQAALAAIRRADHHAPYDLVLADLHMPGMDGAALMQAIDDSALSHKPRVILMAPSGREAALRQQSALLPSAMLPKPLDASQLLDCLLSTVMPDDIKLQPPAALQAHSLPCFAGQRVLLVEDNAINQQITREMLAATGLQVDIANNGREALEKLFAAPDAYHLVLMDIQMPELGGHATTQRIRATEQFRHLPIVALTAHATVEEREQCLRAGMQDHLAKPLHPDQFYHALQRWLKTEHASPAQDGVPEAAADHPPSSPPHGKKESMATALPGFDTDGALKRLGGDQALYEQVLDMMPPLLQSSLDNINAATRQQDQAALRAVVHHVSGMAANVGATALANEAARLEAALKNQSASDDDIEAFCAIIRHTLSVLAARVAARPGGA